MYKWATFFINIVSVQTFFVINKTRVKDLCNVQDLFKYDNFVGDDNFKNIFFK